MILIEKNNRPKFINKTFKSEAYSVKKDRLLLQSRNFLINQLIENVYILFIKKILCDIINGRGWNFFK